MKKTLLFAAVAALGLASCSQDEVIEQVVNEPQKIEFNTYIGQAIQTKAQAAAPDADMTFGVFAHYNGSGSDVTWSSEATKTPDFMSNVKISYTQSTNSCAYDEGTAYYWSTTAEDKYSFFAYSPWTTGTGWNVASGENGPYISYENMTGTDDILVAIPMDNKTKDQLDGDETNNNTDGKVALTFKHALAKLTVKVVGADDIVSSATFTPTSVVIGKAEANKGFPSSGNLGMTLNNNAVQWYEPASENAGTPYALTFDGTWATDTKINEDVFYVRPGDYSDLDVTINYTLKQGETTFDNQKKTGQLTLTSLVAGSQYLITFKVGLDAITFDVKEEGWNEGTGVEWPESGAGA